ncbi:hypothetical protein [Hyalangium gracile]|uniref:hypothetical protein n=1 Tax=Hyalangium gracile TaxID=394092 RepID=UPI001CCF49B7|nr:hypothetical protein [Hyalangium gracile]
MESDQKKREIEELPIRRKSTTRQRGIVGAQWWNDGLTDMQDPMSRRSALKALVAVGGTVAVGGLLVAVATSDSGSSSSYERFENWDTLEAQRAQGWNFGAPDETLTFKDQTPVTPDAAVLDKLVTDMTPRQESLKPFYQATLFQALTPTAGMAREVNDLRAALKPIFTPAMDTAFRQGRAMESLFPLGEEVSRTTAVFVDLPGPESVAFSTGLARRFEPIYTFDNWPHPRGVVPAHLTLGAVLYYRSLLTRLAPERVTPAPPVFVLDRNRLLPYKQVKTQFDNRYLAKLPPAQRLSELGVKNVLYVVPGDGPLEELDDINEDFVSYREAGLSVKLVTASEFKPVEQMAETTPSQPATAEALAELSRQPFYFGGSPASHAAFWSLYALGSRNTGTQAAAPVVPPPRGLLYEPTRRATMFSPPPNSASGAPRHRPNGFAKVQVRVASGTRQLLGFAHGSYSSWNRAPSSSSYSSSGG